MAKHGYAISQGEASGGSRRQPCHQLAGEAAHPAHTNSTVATARETLTATRTEAPTAPMNKQRAQGYEEALTIGHPWLQIALVRPAQGICVRHGGPVRVHSFGPSNT